ncbi:unnamed protein product, partial [Prorocentrum cordatum]
PTERPRYGRPRPLPQRSRQPRAKRPRRRCRAAARGSPTATPLRPPAAAAPAPRLARRRRGSTWPRAARGVPGRGGSRGRGGPPRPSRAGRAGRRTRIGRAVAAGPLPQDQDVQVQHGRHVLARGALPLCAQRGRHEPAARPLPDEAVQGVHEHGAVQRARLQICPHQARAPEAPVHAIEQKGSAGCTSGGQPAAPRRDVAGCSLEARCRTAACKREPPVLGLGQVSQRGEPDGEGWPRRGRAGRGRHLDAGLRPPRARRHPRRPRRERHGWRLVAEPLRPPRHDVPAPAGPSGTSGWAWTAPPRWSSSRPRPSGARTATTRPCSTSARAPRLAGRRRPRLPRGCSRSSSRPCTPRRRPWAPRPPSPWRERRAPSEASDAAAEELPS